MAKFSVATDLLNTLKTWANLLRNLTFSDNFKGFEWEGEIAAGDTIQIVHSLKAIPTRFIILSARDVNTLVQAGRATTNFFYIRNNASTSTFNGRVLILP